MGGGWQTRTFTQQDTALVYDLFHISVYDLNTVTNSIWELFSSCPSYPSIHPFTFHLLILNGIARGPGDYLRQHMAGVHPGDASRMLHITKKSFFFDVCALWDGISVSVNIICKSRLTNAIYSQTDYHNSSQLGQFMPHFNVRLRTDNFSTVLVKMSTVWILLAFIII